MIIVLDDGPRITGQLIIERETGITITTVIQAAGPLGWRPA
jgi:hypothetical protein